MENREKGFAIIVALLFVAVMSAAAAATFFISVADLKISFNRAQSAKSLRRAEKTLAEAQMRMELCLKANGIETCLSETEDALGGITNAVLTAPDAFLLNALGKAGNFSAQIEAVYSVAAGNASLRSWRRKF